MFWTAFGILVAAFLIIQAYLLIGALIYGGILLVINLVRRVFNKIDRSQPHAP